MERKAWLCPSCNKHHGPHVDTCPGETGAQPGSLPAYPITMPYTPPVYVVPRWDQTVPWWQNPVTCQAMMWAQ